MHARGSTKKTKYRRKDGGGGREAIIRATKQEEGREKDLVSIWKIVILSAFSVFYPSACGNGCCCVDSTKSEESPIEISLS